MANLIVFVGGCQKKHIHEGANYKNTGQNLSNNSSKICEKLW